MDENKLRELATRGDEGIDTSDAPELDGWDAAETGRFYRPGTVRKPLPGGGGNTTMNTMEYKGYVGAFDYDPEADLFHGEVINLRDVVTFQGRSVEELKQALANSVEDYLNF